MKRILGILLSAGGGASMAYGIVSLTRVSPESCIGGACLDGIGTDVPLMVGGIVAFIISGFLWHGTWFVGPPVGLVTAAVLLQNDGVDVFGDNLGFTAFIAACVLAGPLILGAIVVVARRKAKLARHLVETGNRAVAHVQGSQQTGVYINHRPQVRVDYTIHPLDGSSPFPHSKTQTLGATEIVPRPGLAWPAWYDPADPSKVAIGAPSGAALDATAEATLAQFGISPAQAYGYDPRGPLPSAGDPLARGF